MLNTTVAKGLPYFHLDSMNLSIFKLPNPKNLIEMEPHHNCVQYYNSKKKENVAMHKIRI